VFLAKKNSDFFHSYVVVISSEAEGEVEKSLEISEISKRCLDSARHDKENESMVSTPGFSPVRTAEGPIKQL